MADSGDEKINLKSHKINCNDNDKAMNPDHIVRKRLPLSFPKRNKDVYVTNKTNFKVNIKKHFYISSNLIN